MTPHSGHTGAHTYSRRTALTLASRIAVGAGVGAGAFALSGCASTVNASSDRMRVVATTPILADLAQQIAGERASVHSLVPAGADPHSYEPSLRDIRDVAYARCALTNGLLLEQRKLSKMVEANLPAGVASVAVAEKIEQYGGKLEAIVEDASLDSIWLGLRVEEGGQNESAPADASEAGMRFEVQSVRARPATATAIGRRAATPRATSTSSGRTGQTASTTRTAASGRSSGRAPGSGCTWPK